MGNRSILKELENEEIVAFYLEDDNRSIRVEEKCDSCFCSYLNKQDFKKMIEELNELYEQMD